MNITIRQYNNALDSQSLDLLLTESFGEKRLGVTNDNIELVAIYDDIVVGYLSINKLYDTIKNINYAYLNYVCVLRKYQNNGIGKKLLEKTFDICKKENISYIELTSNSNREYAHYLYKSSGFNIRDTNVFRKVIM